jgi:molecular chaperone DnaK
MAIIGIDLGTTNSLVAQLDNLGRPQIVHNSDGSNLTPSVVCIDSANRVIVGQEAKSNIGFEKNVFTAFKRKMGSKETYECNGKSLSPTDLSTFILKKLKQDYEQVVGAADSVVITVPANFRNEAREATLAAAREAGLSTDMLLNEPTAAALCYAQHLGRSLDGTYVVYDLGGGTLDVSVIKAKGHDIEVLSSHGLQELGGIDFDKRIWDLVGKKFKDRFQRDFTDAYNFTMLDAEDVKRALSTVSEKKIKLMGPDIPPTVLSVSRLEFEEAISSLIAQTEMLCETALAEAKTTPGQITDIFLAGGSSRVPMVRRMLSQFFRKEPLLIGNPDEAIALGAAIYAGYKTDTENLNPLQKSAVAGMKFQEIAPHYFGTIFYSSEAGRLMNSIIINKNEKIPCFKTESFYTISENQTEVECRITQSPQPEKDPRFVRILWTGSLALPPNRPANQEIQITYSYSENGTMHAIFKDVATGKITEVDIAGQSEGGATSINIDDFIVE